MRTFFAMGAVRIEGRMRSERFPLAPMSADPHTAPLLLVRFRGDEIVERFLCAVAALDAERAAALVSEDFVGTAAPGTLHPRRERIYEGPEGAREWVAELGERFGGAPTIERRIRARGDTILAVGTYSSVTVGAARSTPLPTPEAPEPFAWVFRTHEEEISSAQMYRDVDQVLEAVGTLRGFRGRASDAAA